MGDREARPRGNDAVNHAETGFALGSVGRALRLCDLSRLTGHGVVWEIFHHYTCMGAMLGLCHPKPQTLEHEWDDSLIGVFLPVSGTPKKGP